jgi:hypothetical protein
MATNTITIMKPESLPAWSRLGEHAVGIAELRLPDLLDGEGDRLTGVGAQIFRWRK